MQADSSVLIDRELNIRFSPTRDRIAPLFARCTYILYADTMIRMSFTVFKYYGSRNAWNSSCN